MTMQNTEKKITCSKCGQADITADPESFVEGCDLRLIMEELDVCYECAFWIQKIRLHDDDTYVINGERYHDAKAPKGAMGFTGCGGRMFVIIRNDKRIVITHDLWYQGNIPERFRNETELMDNAMFGRCKLCRLFSACCSEDPHEKADEGGCYKDANFKRLVHENFICESFELKKYYKNADE